MKPFNKFLSDALFASLLFLPAMASAQDWPQWNGPARTGQIEGQGWIDSIPAKGLQAIWRAPVAGGYSGPAVANQRVYVSDFSRLSGTSTNNPGARDKLTGSERIQCLDEKTGKLLWQYSYDVSYALSYAAGPRVTPTVDGGKVYLLGAEGDLVCLNAVNGSLVWKRQLKEDYKTESPIWGYSSSPLIFGQQLICLAGGAGSTVVSFDKATGKEIWRAITASEIGYCPPTLVRAAGVDQLLIWDADKLNSLDPNTGKVYWTEPLQPKYGMSIAAPVLSATSCT